LRWQKPPGIRHALMLRKLQFRSTLPCETNLVQNRRPNILTANLPEIADRSVSYLVCHKWPVIGPQAV
jgi:hypothetical protein